jgi:hypothetical protein
MKPILLICIFIELTINFTLFAQFGSKSGTLVKGASFEVPKKEKQPEKRKKIYGLFMGVSDYSPATELV